MVHVIVGVIIGSICIKQPFYKNKLLSLAASFIRLGVNTLFLLTLECE